MRAPKIPSALLSLLLVSLPAMAQEVGPATGALVIVGGAMRDRAIVEQRDSPGVIGQSYVAIFDHNRSIDTGGSFYFLSPGDSFDLVTREAFRPQEDRVPLDRVVERRWPRQN